MVQKNIYAILRIGYFMSDERDAAAAAEAISSMQQC